MGRARAARRLAVACCLVLVACGKRADDGGSSADTGPAPGSIPCGERLTEVDCWRDVVGATEGYEECAWVEIYSPSPGETEACELGPAAGRCIDTRTVGDGCAVSDCDPHERVFYDTNADGQLEVFIYERCGVEPVGWNQCFVSDPGTVPAACHCLCEAGATGTAGSGSSSATTTASSGSDTSGGSSETSSGSTTTQSGSSTTSGQFCEALLADHESDKCWSNDAARCAVLPSFPDAQLYWHVALLESFAGPGGQEDYSDVELQARLDCLTADVESRGATALSSWEWGRAFLATYAQMAPVLDLQAVRRYELECASDDPPCDCIDHALVDCRDNPFCQPLYGDRWNEAGSCWDFGIDAACESLYVGCGGALTEAEDPDGNCWWFPSTCIPRQPGWTDVGVTCPDPDMGMAC